MKKPMHSAEESAPTRNGDLLARRRGADQVSGFRSASGVPPLEMATQAMAAMLSAATL